MMDMIRKILSVMDDSRPPLLIVPDPAVVTELADIGLRGEAACLPGADVTGRVIITTEPLPLAIAAKATMVVAVTVAEGWRLDLTPYVTLNDCLVVGREYYEATATLGSNKSPAGGGKHR